MKLDPEFGQADTPLSYKIKRNIIVEANTNYMESSRHMTACFIIDALKTKCFNIWSNSVGCVRGGLLEELLLSFETTLLSNLFR